jgi:Domain of unknown function (DUF6794)
MIKKIKRLLGIKKKKTDFGEKIPKNLEETYDFLYKEFTKGPQSSTLLEYLNKNEKDFGAIMHMNGGMWMRNNWGLWSGDTKLYDYFKSIGIGHADDMSGIILDSFYRKFHKRPIRLTDQVKHYQEYWRRQGIDCLTMEKLEK